MVAIGGDRVAEHALGEFERGLPWQVTIGLALLALLTLVLVLRLPLAPGLPLEGVVGAPGTLVPVRSTRPARVLELLVEPGQHVRAGQRLLLLQTGDPAASGEATGPLTAQDAARSAAAASLEPARLAQLDAEAAARNARLSALVQRLDSLDREQSLLLAQRASLERIRTAQRRLPDAFSLTAREATRRDLLMLERDLAVLAQRRSDAIAAQATLRAEVAGLGARRDGALDRARIEAMDLQARELERQAGVQFWLTAPIAGRVASLAVRTGRRVPASTPLAWIASDEAADSLTLYGSNAHPLPLRVGDTLRFDLPAFPRERHGSGEAMVREIDLAVVPVRPAEGVRDRDTPRRRIDLLVTRLPAAVQLVPGLAVRARVSGRPLPLWRWLVDPLARMAGSLHARG